MNIAVIHERKGDFERALALNDSCLKMAIEIGELEFQKTIYSNILT